MFAIRQAVRVPALIRVEALAFRTGDETAQRQTANPAICAPSQAAGSTVVIADPQAPSIAGFFPSEPLRQPCKPPRSGIGEVGRDRQFHLAARIDLAPDFQLPANDLGALPHAMHAVATFVPCRKHASR